MRCYVNQRGMLLSDPDTSDMLTPMACGSCGHIHDTAKVAVIARYLDCSVWRCPNCNLQQDDRESWGFHSPGQARKVGRR